MNLTEEDIRRIVREEIEAYFQRQGQGGNVLEEPQEEYPAVRDAKEDLYKRAMDAMDATLGEQENPKVGIFWYSPQLQDGGHRRGNSPEERHPLGNRHGLRRIVSR